MDSGFLPPIQRKGHLHLGPRLRISGAKPLLPPYVFSSVTLRAHNNDVRFAVSDVDVDIGADISLSLEEQSLTFERSPYDSSCTGKSKLENRLLRRRFRTKTEAVPAGWSTLRRDGRHSCPLNIISRTKFVGQVTHVRNKEHLQNLSPETYKNVQSWVGG